MSGKSCRAGSGPLGTADTRGKPAACQRTQTLENTSPEASLGPREAQPARRRRPPGGHSDPGRWATASRVAGLRAAATARPLHWGLSGGSPADRPRGLSQALPRILWSLTVGDAGPVLAGVAGAGFAGVVTIRGMCWRVGVTGQRGPGRTQESAKIPALSGSLVACPVCHDACPFRSRRCPGHGCLAGGPDAAGPAVPAAGGAAGPPDRGHRGRGGDLRVVRGLAGALPGLRVRVRTGARRVLADGGRRRGRRSAGPDQLAGPSLPLP